RLAYLGSERSINPGFETLVFRCRDDQLDLFLSGTVPITSTTVTYRFSGGGSPITGAWLLSTDSFGIFAPAAATAFFIGDRLLTNDTLYVNYITAGGNQTATYLLRHAASVWPQTGAHCR